MKPTTEKSEVFNDVNYESLDLEDEDLPGRASLTSLIARSSTKRSWVLPFAAGAAAATLILLLFKLVELYVSPALPAAEESFHSLEQAAWNDCGNTSEMAMSRGCVMEPLVYGWMPPQCVFEQLTTQFPVFEDRTWYVDKNLTEVIPGEDLWKGKHDHIYTQRYHTEHCLFQWRKLQYGMHYRKEWLDNKTMSLEHSTHCSDKIGTKGYFLHAEAEDGWNRAGLGFYSCKKTLW